MNLHAATHRAIEAVWRIESAKIIAGVARLVRDIGLAEELAQDALLTALEQWPATGVPDNPGAWLMTTAKNRALDRLRRAKMIEGKLQALGHDLEAQEALIVPDFVDALDAARADEIGDDLLRLIFTACHPLLSTEARAALTLKLLGGLSTEEIARAFLASETTIAQRIVRAKRTLTAAKVPFQVPRGEELAQRLASVLEVVYLIFNEGYTATSGEDWMRPALCDEVLRLGRMLAELAPGEPEAHGLIALMELQASIAACHGRARTGDETDWPRIAALYDALAQVVPSPVVALNRAVAVGMAFGPTAGLQIVDELRESPSLKNYQWLPSVRGDLLAKLGRLEEARTEFERAAEMAGNAREREILLERARKLA